MTRSNRLLALGGIVTLLGAALVAAVLMLQRPADPVSAAPPSSGSEATPASDSRVSADDEAATVPVAVAEVPDGLEAVALTVDFEGSVAGLPQVGDRVHVYGVPASGASTSDDGGPIARLLEDVEVLAVTGADHQTNGGNPTVVLGVEPSAVGATLSSHASGSVHLTLVDRAGGSDDTGDGSQAAGEGDA